MTTSATSPVGPSVARPLRSTVWPPDARDRHELVARLVLTGYAAKLKPTSVPDVRDTLLAALGALTDARLSVDILVTPAGFVEHKEAGDWEGTRGWRTDKDDFDRLARIARNSAEDLVTPEIRDLATRTAPHLLLGIDVWPTGHRRPHGETACLYDATKGIVTDVTGKSYPTVEQQKQLIREADLGSHIVEIGSERVAILVCHDLNAWSPRGNAVSKGVRAKVAKDYRKMLDATEPTLVLHLPHTTEKANAWRPAWKKLRRAAGDRVPTGTSAIRYRTLDRRTPKSPLHERLLAATGIGDRVIDVIVHDEGGSPLS